MDDKWQRELAEEIYVRVWEGEANVDEIVESMSDDPELSEDDSEWILGEVERVYAAKREAEKSWPTVTDCDRLGAAFAALDQSGIVAMHQAHKAALRTDRIRCARPRRSPRHRSPTLKSAADAGIMRASAENRDSLCGSEGGTP